MFPSIRFILLITTPIRKNKPAINVNNNSFICFSFKKRLYSLYSAVSFIISAFIVTFTCNVPFNNSIWFVFVSKTYILNS